MHLTVPIKRSSFIAALLIIVANVIAQPYEAYFDRLAPFQPSVGFGGRAHCLSVNPANDNEVLAVTTTGGIMKTIDRGGNWRNLFGLPPHWVSFVRHAPMLPSNVIATSLNWDFSTAGKGGIWISYNGGETWARPIERSRPAGRVEAYSIATYPGSRRILVATNLGVAISDDNGATFTYQTVPGTSVNAVALMRGDAMIISTSTGIYLWNGFSRSWQQESTGIGVAAEANSFCVPWQFMNNAESASPIFVTTDQSQIQFSNNGGLTWSMVDTLPSGLAPSGGGRFFVKAARNFHNDGFDLFLGDKYGIWRKHCPRTGPNFGVRFNERWNWINQRHSDISDLCLDRTNEAYLAATDGGVQRFWRDIIGDNFSFDGGGGTSANGFHGLEITEVRGTYVGNRRNHDLYFGTQHNDLWASENAGISWPARTGAEGFVIEVPRTVNHENDLKVGYVTCLACNNWISRRLYADQRIVIPSWAEGSSSLIYLKNNTYLTFTGIRRRAAGTIPYSTRYFLTENYTSPDVSPSVLWQPMLWEVPHLVARGVPVRSGIPESQIIYQAYKDYRGPYLTDSIGGADNSPDDTSIQRVKLFRMYLNFNRTGGVYSSDRRFPAMRNFGSIGVFPTEFAWYEVFTADPLYPNHLIAADAVNHRMAESVNGGEDWTPMPNLTSLLTAGGVRFNQGRFTNVSTISFNPDYTQQVMIGTRESGLFFSWNNGRDWQAIPGSDQIREISSIYWQNNNTAIVSSYGRGLYKVQFMFRPARPRIISLITSPILTFIRPGIAAQLGNAQSQYQIDYDAALMVTTGGIEDLTIKNGIVSEVKLSSNASTLLYTDQKQYQAPFQTSTFDPSSMKALFDGFDKLAILKEQGYVINGILLKGGQVVEVIYGKQPLRWPVNEKYTPLQPTGATELKAEGLRMMTISSGTMINGYTYVGPDKKLTLEGVNFPVGLPEPFRILIDGQPYKDAKEFYPQKDGSFTMDLQLDPLKLGYHTITLYSFTKDKKRISETEEFIVMNGDEERKEDKGNNIKKEESKDEKKFEEKKSPEKKSEEKKDNIIDAIKNKVPVKKEDGKKDDKGN